MSNNQAEASRVEQQKRPTTNQLAISLLTSRIKEKRRAADVDHQTKLLDSYIQNLACDVTVTLSTTDLGNVIGIISDKDGRATAEIRLTVGEMGAGEPDYNGVLIKRKADDVERHYNLRERQAPRDLLNGGDGISINHVDTSRYSNFMRR